MNQSTVFDRQKIEAIEGKRIIAPNIFSKNIKESRMPMSIWNFRAEKIQVLTPIARVNPVNITALPVVWSALLKAACNGIPFSMNLKRGVMI